MNAKTVTEEPIDTVFEIRREGDVDIEGEIEREKSNNNSKHVLCVERGAFRTEMAISYRNVCDKHCENVSVHAFFSLLPLCA